MQRRAANWAEFLGEKLLFCFGISALVLLLLIFLMLLKEGVPVFQHTAPTAFLLGHRWLPLSDIFGILPLLLGSLLVTLAASVIALLLGIPTAVFISEVAPRRLREVLKPLIEMLAAVPSVALGFVGLVVVGPLLREWLGLDSGLTALTGAVTLAFMSLPTIVSIADDAIGAVPSSYRDASLALGATHWQTIRRVLLPAARRGIFAAGMLGIGRAIGETMTVMMVTGNAAVIPKWPPLCRFWEAMAEFPGLEGFRATLDYLLAPYFDSVRTMTATIGAEMGEVVWHSGHYHALFAIGLVLFLITFFVNLAADLAVGRR